MKRTLLRSLVAFASLLAVACGGKGGGGGGPPGPTPNALQYDGADDQAVIPFPSFFVPGIAVTLEAWVKPTALLSNAANTAGIVLVPGVCALDVFHPDQTVLGSSVCVPSCNGALSPPATMTVGAWQHVAMTYDGSMIRLYRNGGLVSSIGHSGMGGLSTSVVLGKFDLSFTGLIDEVRLWSVVRTEAELGASMNSILTGSEAGLVGYWRFEEAGGQTILDSTANGHAGTLGGTNAGEADDPTRVVSDCPVS